MQIFSGSEFQPEPLVERIVNQHFSGRRVEQSETSEQKNEDIWRVSTRTDNRRVKAVECHQSTAMKPKFPRGRTKRSGSLSTRTDERNGKVAECHQSTGMKELPV